MVVTNYRVDYPRARYKSTPRRRRGGKRSETRAETYRTPARRVNWRRRRGLAFVRFFEPAQAKPRRLTGRTSGPKGNEIRTGFVRQVPDFSCITRKIPSTERVRSSKISFSVDRGNVNWMRTRCGAIHVRELSAYRETSAPPTTRWRRGASRKKNFLTVPPARTSPYHIFLIVHKVVLNSITSRTFQRTAISFSPRTRAVILIVHERVGRFFVLHNPGRKPRAAKRESFSKIRRSVAQRPDVRGRRGQRADARGFRTDRRGQMIVIG